MNNSGGHAMRALCVVVATIGILGMGWGMMGAPREASFAPLVIAGAILVSGGLIALAICRHPRDG